MKLITPFTSSEKERRLKFYLINREVVEEEGGGALHNAGQGAVNMRDVRVLCVFM